MVPWPASPSVNIEKRLFMDGNYQGARLIISVHGGKPKLRTCLRTSFINPRKKIMKHILTVRK